MFPDYVFPRMSMCPDCGVQKTSMCPNWSYGKKCGHTRFYIYYLPFLLKTMPQERKRLGLICIWSVEVSKILEIR
jgi:hypothetical protein